MRTAWISWSNWQMLVDDEAGGEQRPAPRARSSARLEIGEVVVVAPGLIQARFAGRICVATVEPLMSAVDEQIRQGYRPHLFVDVAESDEYDTDARTMFTNWLAGTRKQMKGVWVLYSSPLVKMGLWLARAFTDGAINGSDDAEEFDRVLDEAKQRAREGADRL
jgi:hypothetical protein